MPMAIIERRRRAHILLVPLSSIGHFKPFLQLLYYLKDSRYRDVVVTVIANKSRAEELSKLQSSGEFEGLDLRLEAALGEIPVFPDPLFPVRAASISEAIERDFEPIKRRLLQERNAFEAPTCIIGDMLFDWLQEIAHELGISWFPLYSCGPSFGLSILELPTLISKGLTPRNPGKLNENVTLPGLTYGRVRDLTTELFEYSEYFALHLQHLKRATAVLVNTAEELDAQSGSVIALRTQLKLMALAENREVPRVLTVGPMITMGGFTSEPSSSIQAAQGSECLQWLDKRAAESVLYVCFGSHCNITHKSMYELACALEASGVSFLWVIRMPSTNATATSSISNVLPRDFEARMKGRGFIETRWAPQSAILKHPATGGFLSHCGWNSTLEGICTGVPFITWPINAEQPFNARFITHGVKVGVPVSTRESEVGGYLAVGRDEIEKAVRQLMLGEEGKEARRRSQRLKKAAAASVAEGGASYNALHSFLNEISTFSSNLPRFQ